MTASSYLLEQEQFQPILRQAAQEGLAGSFLYAGPLGTGKAQAAVLTAQALLCEKTNRPCGLCGSCLRVQKDQSESLLSVPAEGTTIKIETARAVVQFLALRSVNRNQVVIIHEAQRLNAQASNALLKSIEEPPEGTVFILTSSEPLALLPTLRSRLKIVRFHPLTTQALKTEFPKAQPWMLEASRGQLNRLKFFMEEEAGQKKSEFLKFFIELLGADDSGVSPFEDGPHFKMGLEFWQQFVRDFLYLRLGSSDLLHPDLAGPAKRFETLSEAHLQNIYKALTMAYRDLESHVDRGLIYENLRLLFQKGLAYPGNL